VKQEKKNMEYFRSTYTVTSFAGSYPTCKRISCASFLY